MEWQEYISFNPLKCIWHEIFFFGFRDSDVYKKRFSLKTCLEFLKTSFFAGKRHYFSLKNRPGDWDRIYRIVTSIDLIAFPRTQCFCYKSPQNVDSVQQYRGSFRNFQDLQWERTSRRKNRAVLGLIKPDDDEHFRCLLSFRTVVRMLISKSIIYPDCSSVEAPQLWDFFVEFF